MGEEKKQAGDDRDDLVEAVSVQGEMNARILVDILESEGVEVMLKSHQTFGALPFTVDGMGAVRVMVRREDLTRARVIIEEYVAAGKNPALTRMLSEWEPPDGTVS
jgi:hypothetical protein